MWKKKVVLGKLDRSMKIFNPAYFLKSELIHRQHRNSFIYPLLDLRKVANTRSTICFHTNLYRSRT